MLVEKLEHYNIVTEKLDETVAFYESIVGLENGDRPNFAFPGAWLYAGDDPVVHLMKLGEEREPGSGSIDHVAFRGSDHATYKKHLEANGVEYDERFVEEIAMYQLFFRDPNGVKVEVNFLQKA